MTRVVISKEERKAKKPGKKTWQPCRCSHVAGKFQFQKVAQRMEDGYHPNDESRSWMAERGNLANKSTEEDQGDIGKNAWRADQSGCSQHHILQS